MERKLEIAIIANQAQIDRKSAESFVDFAVEVRKAFGAGKISSTISSRELIAAGRLGLVRGSDWRSGIKLGFTNRLSRVDKIVVDEFAQRKFG